VLKFTQAAFALALAFRGGNGSSAAATRGKTRA